MQMLANANMMNGNQVNVIPAEYQHVSTAIVSMLADVVVHHVLTGV